MSGDLIEYPRQLDRYHHLPPYRLPGRDVQIELHGMLLDRSVGVQVDLPGVWQRASQGKIARRPALWLAPEDLPLHLAVHLCAVNRFHTGLRHLVDLAEVVRFCGARLDWAGVGARAANWGAAECVYLALRTAEELLGCPDAGGALPSLCPEGFDERLAAAACQRVLSGATRGAGASQR